MSTLLSRRAPLPCSLSSIWVVVLAVGRGESWPLAHAMTSESIIAELEFDMRFWCC